MLREYIANLAIITSMVFIAGHIVRKDSFDKNITVLKGLYLGLIFGIFGTFSLLFTIEIGNGFIFDLRHLVIILTMMYGNVWSMIVTTSILILMRLLLVPITVKSLATLSIFFSIMIFCAFIYKQKWTMARKYTISNVMALGSIYLVYMIFLDPSLFQIALWKGIPLSLLGAIIVYYLYKVVEKDAKLYRKFKKESTKDFLTGVNNVRQFDLFLNRMSEKSLEDDTPLSLLFIDIDFFKKVNDSYGHPIGDLVLKKFAEVLSDLVSEKDFISRNGGEEFAVLLPECDHQQAIFFAERIRKQIEETPFIIHDNKSISTTVSIGVATLCETTRDIEELIIQADSALYSAKQVGRNRVCSIQRCKSCKFRRGEEPNCSYPLDS
ncbi:GGDEF domain-containing protein [Peribacillus tepidiphilus]|uniref:GGDEF domain-containing protein n=1 Tax=Peribacillus tepidiphilus TaxID=2652445 RepID=UPI0035B51AF2